MTTERMRELVRSAKQGDRAAEDVVFRHLRVRFLFLAKQRIGMSYAEDVAQEACTTVFEKYRSSPDDREFQAWAYEILRNKIGNYLQKAAVRARAGADLPSAAASESLTTDPDLRARLVACLRRIVRRHRRYARVLNLVHQGYDTGEICRRLDIRAGNLYVMLNRARGLLRDCLERGREQHG